MFGENNIFAIPFGDAGVAGVTHVSMHLSPSQFIKPHYTNNVSKAEQS